MFEIINNNLVTMKNKLTFLLNGALKNVDKLK